MPRPISYAVFCLKKKKHNNKDHRSHCHQPRVHPIHNLASAAHHSRDRSVLRLRYGAGHRGVHERYALDSQRMLEGTVVEMVVFFFNDTATTEIYTLSLHDALPIYDKSAQIYARFDKNDWRIQPAE